MNITFIFPGGSVVKNLPANAGDARNAGLIPGSGRSPAGGYGTPLQYSCLENSMDRGARWATVHRAAKSRTWLSTHTHTHTHSLMLSLYRLRASPGGQWVRSPKHPFLVCFGFCFKFQCCCFGFCVISNPLCPSPMVDLVPWLEKSFFHLLAMFSCYTSALDSKPWAQPKPLCFGKEASRGLPWWSSG